MQRPTPRFDLLTTPILGRFLRWRHARRALQLALAALAVVVIVDGLRGPQVAPMNLAGVLPWIHWRGLLILSLLVAGNFFCMACPFTLPRSLARRWLPAGRPWPRWLRSKWLAAALVAIFLWSYEAFALWDSPWITAWIVIGYFVAAFAVDSLFAGAAFCKYVCPIGQFNFVQSLVSPLEVAVREPAVCTTCTTKECIRGSATIPGCELHLFQPRKHGNLDCTFCLDCVHACPHANVGILATVAGPHALERSVPLGHRPLQPPPRPRRARAGARLRRVRQRGRHDRARRRVARSTATRDSAIRRNWRSPPPAISSRSSCCRSPPSRSPPPRAATGPRSATRRSTTATRFAFALVPIGFGMWLAHYSFHLFTSWETILPATQRFAADRGWTALGEPLWECACCQGAAAWIPHVEILMLDFGLLAVALRRLPHRRSRHHEHPASPESVHARGRR